MVFSAKSQQFLPRWCGRRGWVWFYGGGKKRTSPDEDAPVDCLFFYDLVATVCLGLVHGAVYPVKNALCRVVG